MYENLLTELKCNSCGATVDIDFDNLISFCPYCGAKLMIDVPSIQELLIEKEKTKQIKIQTEQISTQKKMDYDAKLRTIKYHEKLSSQTGKDFFRFIFMIFELLVIFLLIGEVLFP